MRRTIIEEPRMNQVKTTSGKFTPPQFSEVIFKTSRFAAMKDWHETVTDVKAFFVRNDATKPTWAGALNIRIRRCWAFLKCLQSRAAPTI
jgi:NADPH-dependent ferric siderophore reductase